MRAVSFAIFLTTLCEVSSSLASITSHTSSPTFQFLPRSSLSLHRHKDSHVHSVHSDLIKPNAAAYHSPSPFVSHGHGSTSGLSSRSIRRGNGIGARRLTERQSFTSLLSQLQSAQANMANKQSSVHESRLSLQRNPAKGKNGKFSYEVANQLVEYRKAGGAMTPVLAQLYVALSGFGEDEGKANYDRTNQVEVILKEIVDSIKYTLDDVNLLVYSLPVLGPILGPIVYDIKCVVDELVNGLENTLDSTLNGLVPELESVTDSLGLSVCSLLPGFQIC